MKSLSRLLCVLLILPALLSCNSKLDVTADWKDITVVYGLLNQNDTVHYVKITKAFLGEGNAMVFAKTPDSSNYPDKLDVRLEEWNGTNLLRTFLFDTATIHNKEAGDSIFYYPDQLMYVTHGKLVESNAYRLFIKYKNTNKEVTAQTVLVHRFDIEKPRAGIPATFDTTLMQEAKWNSAVNGRRYQLLIRFRYHDIIGNDTNYRFVDWIVFSDKRSVLLDGNEVFDVNYPGRGFYQNLKNKIPAADLVNPQLTRTADTIQYIFTIAGDDMSTYMDVTEPSSSIVQEKPFFTNVTNGIGLFSARYDNTVETPRAVKVSQATKDNLKVCSLTKDLGFYRQVKK